MGSRCVTGRLLLVVVRPDRNVDAPVDGGRGRSLTDCVARLVSAPILARSWTPSVARVTAPASSILRDPHKKAKPFGSRGENEFEKSFCMPRPSCEDATCPPHDTSAELKPSSIPHRIEFSYTLSNPPELPNYSIHTLPLIHRTTWLLVPGRDIGRLSRCGLTSVQSLHALACRP